MGPKTAVSEDDLFRHPLREQINLKHPLVRLADLINWDRLGTSMSASFVSRKGRPATSPRLIAGLLYLQHAFDLSDEEVVWQWVENPYWQVFTGETYLVGAYMGTTRLPRRTCVQTVRSVASLYPAH